MMTKAALLIAIQETPASLNGWALLMKFGQRKHLEALRDEGLLYLNPQSYFAAIESDVVRRDPFEGTDQIHQPADIKELVISGPCDQVGTMQEIVIPSADLAGPLSVTLTTTNRYNLFCMYGLAAPLTPPFVDERNFQFGDSFIIVLNTQAFLNRVRSAIAAAHFNCEYRFVGHYDPTTHSGDTGVFRKSHEFAYQNEFRIAVWPGLSEALQLRVGSLIDITSPVLPLVEINQLVDFGEEAARAAGLT